ncbi:glycoside hydrolase family 31 protein [Streptomyces ureilyticus]|uniref:Glycoside hydrolase family 31 protein n=1 Tax=Streptomyces ureilyticus TaxID=1775131 RepID=A0ABX0DP21_9ACTN|nr:glycoside hydrolase family 31 protein [Streptomyces ureilyticus]NGO41524.1 glycoside hydrolase family 31 protein [Streptomyces ureilyticus]
MPVFRVLDEALEVRHRHEVLRVEAWGTDSARVRVAQYRIPTDSVGALEAPPEHTSTATVGAEKTTAQLVNGELTVTVVFHGNAAYPEAQLTFTRTSTGEELLTEQREHPWAPGAREFKGNRSGAYEIHQRFAAYEGERLYGLGQHTHGRLDHKGLRLDLVQRNGEVSIPFVLSSRGYGFLWNQPALGRVEFAENATRWTADQARGIDYWITAAPTPRDILARYADATGHAPELPDWASGFWQCKLRYRTQDELLAVAREHKSRGLPMSVIVSDYFHWSAMGDYRFDPDEWPDPQAMVDELADLGIELMVSIWPTVSPLSENYEDFRDRGLLLGSDQGAEVHHLVQDKGMAARMQVSVYDPTNPETRDYVWDLIRRNYLDLGIRVFWLDACEPELDPAHHANTTLYAGPGAQTVNVYPRDNARLFAEGMAAAGQPGTVLLSRSAWAGSQKYGAAVWSGDIPATWDSLRAQVRAGLSVAVSGIPWWTTDIGGFHGGNPDDPAYRELMIRWFQYGVFCPLFRLHGDREPRMPWGYAQTGGPNEVWSYGEEAYGILKAQLFLRERLRPYLHEQMRTAAADGVPPMRPLFVDFPQDAASWTVEDQFLFGPDILVAPVTEPGARSREVYLPAGRTWTDAWTGDSYEGGRTLTVEAPIERIPVFMTQGAELPLIEEGE